MTDSGTPTTDAPRLEPRRRTELAAGVLAAAALLALVLAALTLSQLDSRAGQVAEVIDEHAAALGESVRRDLVDAVLQAEQRHGIDPFLTLAVIEKESRFDPAARGPRGGRGLMQVKPGTARSVANASGVAIEDAAELFDPVANVRAGTAYLAEMYEKFGDWPAALAAYNQGPTRVARVVRQGRTPRSSYASAILARRDELAGQAPGEAAADDGGV